jgi:hypothetical protein
LLTIQSSTAGGVRLSSTQAVLERDQLAKGAECHQAAEEIRLRAAERKCPISDSRSKLQVFQQELEFLTSGGYRLALGWRAPLIFEDSPICPKSSRSACPDVHCILMDLVPREHRQDRIPCRHIPLNGAGETLHTLYSTAAIHEIEVLLSDWLRSKIAELERPSDSPHEASI